MTPVFRPTKTSIVGKSALKTLRSMDFGFLIRVLGSSEHTSPLDFDTREDSLGNVEQ